MDSSADRWVNYSSQSPQSSPRRSSLRRSSPSFSSPNYSPPRVIENSSSPVKHENKNIVDDSESLEIPKSKPKSRFFYYLGKRTAKKDVDPKDRRRSRNDNRGRDYNCGCGKKYLSYPALFLHIQQKHSGVELQGTNKSLPGANHKRGRPKKTLNEFGQENKSRPRSRPKPRSRPIPLPKKEFVPQKIKQQPKKSSTQVEPKEPREVSRKPKLIKLPPKTLFSIDKYSMELFKNYPIASQGIPNPLQAITFDKFLNYATIPIRAFYSKKLVQNFLIDEAMYRFLYSLSLECNPSIMRHVESVLICFRSCLNSHYTKLAENPLNPNPTSSNPPRNFKLEAFVTLPDMYREFSQLNSCKFVPLLVNFFLRQYAVNNLPDLDSDLIDTVVKDFCVWAHGHQMSHFQVMTFHACSQMRQKKQEKKRRLDEINNFIDMKLMEQDEERKRNISQSDRNYFEMLRAVQIEDEDERNA